MNFMFLLGAGGPGVYYAFEHSDAVGKAIVVFLLIGSVLTWSIMLDKEPADRFGVFCGKR